MTLNHILASIALILAVLAAFIGNPGRGDHTLNEIATLIETEEDHITPLELAGQIYGGRKIRVIDLRDSVSYMQQHIVNAERMSIVQLLNNGVKRNETVVMYSEEGIHASQVWILLKTKHYDSVYTLLGGFTGWKEEILFPVLPVAATDGERRDLDRRKMLSLFFGGDPKVIPREDSSKKSARQSQSPRKKKPPVRVKKEEEKLRYQC